MGVMELAGSAAEGLVRHLTTDQAVRAGMTTAAWSSSASYARGLLPRTPVQQAAATGVVVTAHYAFGATLWSGIASVAAGLPGSRAGNRALVVAAAATAIGGKALEMRLRPRSGDSLLHGAAWSQAKMFSVVGLAGGLVTASDILAHEVLDLPRTPTTTLALDLTTGGLMASGTWLRRRRRAKQFHGSGRIHHSVGSPTRKAGRRNEMIAQAKTGAFVGAAVMGTSLGLGVLAVSEQAVARQATRGLNALADEDLGEFSVAAGHGATFAGFAVAGYLGLRAMRKRLERGSVVIEPGYQEPPASPFVSAGPRSTVNFDGIGREGRRFVTMRLTATEIESVMHSEAVEPVRVVIPRSGSIAKRAALAVSELISTGGIDRSLICVASPTGVGYVNYVMGEALEYLALGDCAIVEPQYAYVPSLLALNKTDEATQLQRAVITSITRALRQRDPNSTTRVVQFGESLGAQVAADVGGSRGVPGFDETGLSGGLYLGVPFRSSLWRAYRQDPEALTGSGRLVVAPDSRSLTVGSDRHVLLIHDDDPITKFAYSMVVQRPWWMGAPETRPAKVPRETYFRPVTSFVLALVDVFNGMNTKPGAFSRTGHDYRADMREALQITFELPVEPAQAAGIEAALVAREREWAQIRLIARTGEKALRSIRETLHSWGRDSVNLELDELPGQDASHGLVAYLSQRLGSTGKT